VITNQGGWQRVEAFASRVRLVRDNPEEREVYRIRCDRFVRGDLRTNVLVRNRDMVYVPATWLAEIIYTTEMITRPIRSVALGAEDLGAIPYEGRARFYEEKQAMEASRRRAKD
jgi:hypothetical protein